MNDSWHILYRGTLVAAVVAVAVTAAAAAAAVVAVVAVVDIRLRHYCRWTLANFLSRITLYFFEIYLIFLNI